MIANPQPHSLYPALVTPRLPLWLADASADDLQRLDDLTQRAEASRRALAAAAMRLPQYRVYASQVLVGALAALGQPDVEPTTAVLHWTDPDGEQPALTCTLVEAALRNFTETDARPEAFGEGSGLFARRQGQGEPVPTRKLAVSPWAFAQACRRIDIGAGFARHLAAELPLSSTSTAPAQASDLPGLFCQADRDTFAAEAHIAKLKGNLDGVGASLLATWGLAPYAHAVPRPGSAKRLTLGEFELDRVVVLLAEDSDAQGHACLLYIPNDPHSPLTQFPNVDSMTKALNARLADPGYLRFFAGFVALAKEAEFIRTVEGTSTEDFEQVLATAVNPVKALLLGVGVLQGKPVLQRPELSIGLLSVHDLFADLYASWAQRTLVNAQVLAVPTAQIDRRAVLARHEHWLALGEQLGLFVLSFVPGVGQVIAVYSMVQALQSVFEASQAWLKGDEALARSLLFGAVENARYLLPGDHGSGGTQPEDLLERVRLVARPDGETRLWLPDLHIGGSVERPGREGTAAIDGVYRQDGRAWVRLGERYVEVYPSATPYLAEPLTPTGDSGYVPRLLGNGVGGWHAEYERPSQWSLAALVRRSGDESPALADATITEASRFAGMDDHVLQAATWRGERLPGLLRYWLHRRAQAAQLEQAIATLRGQARQPLAHPAVVRTLLNVPHWPMDVGLALKQADGSYLELQEHTIRSVRLTPQQLADGSWLKVMVSQLGVNDLAPLFAEPDSLTGAAQRLAISWAQVLEAERATVLRALSESPGTTVVADANALSTLGRQFPSLPQTVLEDVLALADSTQRERLEHGRVPLPMAEVAVQCQRALRIGLACEALQEGLSTPDRDVLLMGLLSRLDAWPPALAIELRQVSPAGRLVYRAGPATGPARIITAVADRYRLEGEPDTLPVEAVSLEQAVVDLLRRQGGVLAASLADGLALRQQLASFGLANRTEVARLLGMASQTQRLFRLPNRLVDGRLGYLLSGRGAGRSSAPEEDEINQQLMELYPDTDDHTHELLRAEIGQGAAAFEALARHRQALTNLRAELGQWLRSPLPEGANASNLRPARELAVRIILQAWQRRFVSVRATPADGTVRHSLSLAYLHLGSDLPVVNTRFNHILELDISGMALEAVAPDFLRMFPNARILHLSDNPLRELPTGPTGLQRLRELYLRNIGQGCASQLLSWLQPMTATLRRLQLSDNPGLPVDQLLPRLIHFSRLEGLALENNQLRLTPETQGVFSTLTRLNHLRLDGNPLGLAPSVEGLRELTWLSVADAQIGTLPAGLEQLMAEPLLRLTYVNLAGNAITHIPDLTATEFFRHAALGLDDLMVVEFNLQANPLDAESVALLDRSRISFDLPTNEDSDASVTAPDLWLEGCPEPLQGAIRAAQQERAAADFYDVLGRVVNTAQYRRAQTSEERAQLRARAWALAERFVLPGEQALPGLSELREHFYEIARDARGTCGDGVALTLDQFEGELGVWEAIAGSVEDSPPRALAAALVPARRLYRQALVDAQAQRLVRARQARLEVRSSTDAAQDLEDDIPLHQLDMGVDEVELRLMLRQRLETELDLPPAPARLYDSVVGDTTIARIAERVRALDTDSDFAQWLVAHQPMWNRALQRTHADEFEHARAAYDEALEYVLVQAARGEVAPLSDQGVALLEVLEPEIQWRQATGQEAGPPVNEQQAYVLSRRLSEAAERAADALRLRLTLALLN